MTPKPITILLIEDNLGDVRLIQEALREGQLARGLPPAFDVNHAARLEDAIVYLKQTTFDCILLDLSLPDSQNLYTLRRIQQAAPYTPIVILSGNDNELMAIEAVRAGAQDYLTKGSDNLGSMLRRSLRYAIERFRLLAQLEQKSLALAASEAQREAILERNADGIIIVTQDGIVQFINQAAAAMLQTSRQKLVGQPFSLPLTHEALTHEALTHEALTDGAHTRGDTAELNVTKQGGSTANIEMIIVETEWQGEKVYQASLRDITYLKEAEEKIRQRAEELAAQNMALDEFAHTMAHQIQGLLGQMVGYASFLEMHYSAALDEEAQHSISRIVQSGHKMNNVISELLLLASMRASDVHQSALDLARIVAEVCKRLKFQIESYHAEITQQETWPTPAGHAPWIEEALLNYVSNALKYGGDPPHIDMGAAVQADGMVRVWVKDNGHGLTVEEQQQLFKPHTRLRHVRIRGEGLGLSIVKRIIKRSGGEVGVDSAPEQGSTFWFTLPAAASID